MMLKKNTLLVIISLFALHIGYSQIITGEGEKKGQVIDEIIAQVGNHPVFLSDIEAQKLQMRSEGIEIDEGAFCAILEESLYQKLLLNQAQRDSLDITDEQVNAEMENRLRMIEQQIGSREKLEQFYGKTYSQIKDEFRDDIRDRMLSQEMERQIIDGTEVSPMEVNEFFNNIPEDSLPYINENISIQQIVIYPKISPESVNEVLDKMNRWREQVINGERDFSQLATLHSEDLGSARDGGKIEATRGMMVKPFEAAAFSLKPGEVSNIVKTQYGYHLVQLIDRRGDDYTVRHILLTPEIGRQELGEAANLMDECYQKLKSNEVTWAQAVKEYSEDDETKHNQGTIVNPYTGELYWDVANINQIDPQIFELVHGLNTGSISSPALYTDMQSRKEGVRIVRISNRTKPHKANLKDDYNFIKQAAENHKQEKIISEWVNKQIKNNYIRMDEKYQDCKFIYEWAN